MKPSPVHAYVGIGGNLGDAKRRVHGAVSVLAAIEGVRGVRASRLYRTAPWGFLQQPDFINAVVRLDTWLAAPALLARLHDVERRFGRRRGGDGPRWGPRTLDLDLLLYGDADITSPGLRVPHPRMHQRAFVLLPLLEIAPAIEIPGHGPAHALPAAMAAQGVEALG